MKPKELVRALVAMRFANTFNPYSDRCEQYDLDGAANQRRVTLERLLERAVNTGVDSLWIGRDLGYRGGRRTGLALTDDVHVQAHGERWGLRVERCTRGREIGERTARIVWHVLEQIEVPIFLWNVFPLHPHGVGQPLSNRVHNARERCAGEEVLRALIKMLRPVRLVPIGTEAARSVRRLAGGGGVVEMRHPSYGGQNIFREQARVAYGLG